RRRMLALFILSVVLAACTRASHAQSYPSKPIRMIVPIGAGGGTDIVGRLISPLLSEQMGVTLLVDNRPGAGSVIGTELLAKSAPDGYTLMNVAPEFVINPSLRKLPYDPIRDFTCVSQVTSGQYFLSTHPAVPVKTTKQFLALTKSRPGTVTYASSGPGSANHLAGVLYQHMTGTNLIHVPYKSSGQASVAVISGEVDFMFSSIVSVISQIRQGRLRAIATTGATRSPTAPEVPTLNESGIPGFVVTGFYMVLAPAGVPPDILAKLNSETVKAVKSAAMKERLATMGLEPVGSSSADCGKFIQAEISKWAPIVKASGAKAD
ncbi:MAG TPA: tripartite tricarboxylate transporter substrate binding protein, partial [Burkholderiales bacterium]